MKRLEIGDAVMFRVRLTDTPELAHVANVRPDGRLPYYLECADGARVFAARNEITPTSDPNEQAEWVVVTADGYSDYRLECGVCGDTMRGFETKEEARHWGRKHEVDCDGAA